MIPTVQMISNSNMFTNIHPDILEKFSLTITPNPSPILNSEREIVEVIQDTQAVQHISCNGAQKYISHEEFLKYYNDMRSISVSQMDLNTRSIDDNNSNSPNNDATMPNCTFIGNGLIVIDGSQIDIDDDGAYSSNNSDKSSINISEDMNCVFDMKCSGYDKSPSVEHKEIVKKEICNKRTEIVKTKQISIDSNDTIKNENIETNDVDDDSSSENELTNLGWLIDLKNITQWPTDSNSSKSKYLNGKTSVSAGGNMISNCIIGDIDENDECIGPIVSDKDLSEERFRKFTIQVEQSQKNYAEREIIYKMDPLEKPPFNYAQIIAMAMMDQGRMTLKDICKWIQEHFAYFRYNKNWNNSIRHNLSLHFCFTKIARDKTEKGKGGYWELSMNATKSEKKRIRNRRKHRDESGRFSHSLRSGRSSCKSYQKQNLTSHVTQCSHRPNRSTDSTQEAPNFDSCNASMGSDASSSICSANGITEATTATIWPKLIDARSPNTLSLAHSINSNDEELVINERVEEEFIDDVISNDFVIIDGIVLHRNDLEHHQLNYSNSNATSVMLNDSSNEIFIKNDSNHQMNLINGATPINVPVSTSNVIVEPMPYCLSHMDTIIDIEHEFSSLVHIPDPELTEDNFFDYSNW